MCHGVYYDLARKERSVINFKLILALLLLPLLCACGVKFGDAPVNLPVPEGFRSRSVYPTGVAAYTFEDLVGAILVIEKGRDPERLGIVLPTDQTVEVHLIETPLHSYESRITAGAEAQGGYLAFAARMKSNSIAHIRLSDVARAGVRYVNRPDVWQSIESQLVEWVESHPKKGNEKRVWIKELVLVQKSLNVYHEISANASGQVGAVTGVEGKVYATYEKDDLTTLVTFDCSDIDYVVDLLKRKEEKNFEAMLLTPEQILEKARYAQEIQGEVK